MNKALEKKLTNQIKQFEKETKEHLDFIFHNVINEISNIAQNQSTCKIECFLPTTFFDKLNGLDFRLSLKNKTRLNSKTLEAFANASRTLNSLDDIHFISFNLEITSVFASLDTYGSATIKKESICIASASSILALIPIVKSYSIRDVLLNFECLKNIKMGCYEQLLNAYNENSELNEKTFLNSLQEQASSN